MNGAGRSLFALLAVVTGTAVATTDAAAQRCCNQAPRLLVAVESGAYWAETDELVEARPEHAAEFLSHLAWDARGDVIGVSLSYRPRGVLRAHGGMWYLGHTRSGHLVNLDYLDSTSGAVTHRSVSPSEFAGVGWKLATDLLLVEEERGEVLVRAFVRLGYRGNYHVWNARGGEYEYPGREGRFDDGEHLVRYVVRHQAFHAGVFLELGQAKGDGLYGRMGAAVSFLPWVEDRDTHVLSDTDYHNTYRLGWYVRPEIAVGVGLGPVCMMWARARRSADTPCVRPSVCVASAPTCAAPIG